jgi:tetratricopeptide (TPR) repeat protein
MRSPAAHSLKLVALVCLVAAAPRVSFADTIYLKNGKKIFASHVIQENGQVSYETAAGRLSLPASIVDKVVEGSLPFDPAVAGTPGDRAANLPIAPPHPLGPTGNDDVTRATVHDGRVDIGFLNGLESEANANPTPAAVSRVVAAESAAARLEVSQGDYDQALAHYGTALRFAPAETGLLLDTAYLHLRRSEYSAALDLLERARSGASDSPDVAKLSGWAYYGLNRLGDAVREWKRALALQPDAEVQHALAKAERDAREESNYREGVTAHFRLRYNGDADPELARNVLRTLETEYGEVSYALNYTPPEPIGVILYTDKVFTDITQAPSWVGALNDGRIRVPVDGLISVTDELARVLKHELTHSFIMQKTRGRCPVWLQEGIAQYMEGKRSHMAAAQLVSAYQQHMEISLASYETSWMNLPKDAVANAYAWSLAVVEAIVSEGGMVDIEHILDRIADDSSGEDAMRSVLHESYRDAMQATADYLRKAYL